MVKQDWRHPPAGTSAEEAVDSMPDEASGAVAFDHAGEARTAVWYCGMTGGQPENRSLTNLTINGERDVSDDEGWHDELVALDASMAKTKSK